MADPTDDLSDEDRARFRTFRQAHDLADAAATLRGLGWRAGDAAEIAVNTLMTEFWDRGFSQTEIREAFEAALADMNRYAAGRERR